MPDEEWKALNFFATLHQQQIRKIDEEPFIKHPYETWQLVAMVTADRDTRIAALGHDSVEDTEITLEEIEELFGANVARIIWGVTKDPTIEDRHECKVAYLARLKDEAPEESVVIALADKISNLKDTLHHHKALGDEIWQNFSSGPAEQLWWYESVFEIGVLRQPDCPLLPMLAALIVELRVAVKA